MIVLVRHPQRGGLPGGFAVDIAEHDHASCAELLCRGYRFPRAVMLQDDDGSVEFIYHEATTEKIS